MLQFLGVNGMIVLGFGFDQTHWTESKALTPHFSQKFK